MNNLKEKNRELIYSFSKLNDYDDLEIIYDELNKYFNINILKKLDGPDMRIWDIEIDSKQLQLYNDPYGNYLITSILNETFLKQIIKIFD